MKASQKYIHTYKNKFNNILECAQISKCAIVSLCLMFGTYSYSKAQNTLKLKCDDVIIKFNRNNINNEFWQFFAEVSFKKK